MKKNKQTESLIQTQNQNQTSKKEVIKKKYSQGLPVFNQFAAGIDVGDTFFEVAISDGVEGHEVR